MLKITNYGTGTIVVQRKSSGPDILLSKDDDLIVLAKKNIRK
jgi:hypothetical protein